MPGQQKRTSRPRLVSRGCATTAIALRRVSRSTSARARRSAGRRSSSRPTRPRRVREILRFVEHLVEHVRVRLERGRRLRPELPRLRVGGGGVSDLVPVDDGVQAARRRVLDRRLQVSIEVSIRIRPPIRGIDRQPDDTGVSALGGIANQIDQPSPRPRPIEGEPPRQMLTSYTMSISVN
jgi:hypothetical protein